MSQAADHPTNKFFSIPRSPIVIGGSAFILLMLTFVVVAIESTKIQRSFMHLNGLYAGLSAYARDNGGDLPDMSRMEAVERSLYPKYVGSRYPFRDPYTNRYFKTNPLMSFQSLATLQRLPCPPVLLYSSDELVRDRLFASGKLTQPDSCKFIGAKSGRAR